jgi:hypothetical protein
MMETVNQFTIAKTNKQGLSQSEINDEVLPILRLLRTKNLILDYGLNKESSIVVATHLRNRFGDKYTILDSGSKSAVTSRRHSK